MKLSRTKVTSLRGNVQINLRGHQIRDITSLETGLDENSQTNLLSLDLGDNMIQEIKSLHCFVNLWVLDLGKNIEIVDYSALVHVKMIGRLAVAAPPDGSEAQISL